MLTYAELLGHYQPRPIDSEEEHSRALAVIRELMDRPRLNTDERAILESFVLFVGDYESSRHPLPDLPASKMLKHLMEARGVSGVELSRATDVPRSTVSEILSEKRMISRRNAASLAEFFGVDASLFFQVPPADPATGTPPMLPGEAAPAS